MVVTIPEQDNGYHMIPANRIACCVIGLASGPEKPSYAHINRGYDNNDYGYNNSYDAPIHGLGRRDIY